MSTPANAGMNGETIKHLAHLARLSVPESELDGLAADVASMVGFVDKIQQVSANEVREKVGGDSQGDAAINVYRDDSIAPLHHAHDLVEAAPQHKDHFVQVPKVLE